MKVRFWGTRGSIPKPGRGTLRYGGNTSCVELRSAAGTRIVLDCGSGAQDLGQALMRSSQRPLSGHILISHTHWDHIQGLPFFAPLFVPGNRWDIYGPHGFCHSLREALAGQMQYTYFPVALEQFAATTCYRDLVEGIFQIDDISIRTQYLNHPALTLGYRLQVDGLSLVYACDHEPFSRYLALGRGEVGGQDRRHLDFLREADLVIHDGQYTADEYTSKVGWGHSPIEYVVRLCRLAGVRNLALTHHDPLRSDEALDRIIERVRAEVSSPLEIFAAAERQEIDLLPGAASALPDLSGAVPAVQNLPPALDEQLVMLVAADAGLKRSIGDAVRADQVRVLEALPDPSVASHVVTARPSLVVLEHAPPHTNALTICREIRDLEDHRGEVPVVLVASKEDTAGLDAGVTDWLIKPYSEVYARTKFHAWLMRTLCRWQRAPLPSNEQRRLNSLHNLKILDTPREDRFDRISRLAAALFDVPIVLVSLVDQDRQWFKSCYGLKVQETSREVSFCAHAILADEVMMVPDTLLDLRFADNPVVLEEPRVRFYAGYPLVLQDGSRVGTLCIIDTRPRHIEKSRLGFLQDLGRLVERELEISQRLDARFID